MDNQNQQFGSINTMNVATTEGEKKSPHGYRMVIVTAVVLILAIGGYAATKNTYVQEKFLNKPQATKPVTIEQVSGAPVKPTASTIEDRKGPWLEVAPAAAGNPKVGSTFDVYIKAFSGGKDVTGYDMLIGFDHDIVDLASVTSENTDYEIFKFDKKTHMTVTGIKNFQKKEPSVLDNTTLIKLTFTAKKNGTAIVSVFGTQGKENTQFVDADVKVSKPQIGSLQLEIE